MDSFEEAKTALKRNVKDMAEFAKTKRRCNSAKTKRRWLQLGVDCHLVQEEWAGNKKAFC